jgi:hypothetical protein
MCFDGDTYEVLDIKIRRARKTYRCGECNQPIEPGDTYERMVGVLDGLDTHRSCLKCAEARRWLEVVCSTWAYGGVWEDLMEHWSEDWLYRSHGLGRLILTIRSPRRWKTATPQEIRAMVDSALATINRRKLAVA